MVVKKIIVCVLVTFFEVLFLACSSSDKNKFLGPKEEPLNLVNLDHDWTQITNTASFDWEKMDGFFPSDDYPYGFDRHPAPEKDSLDNIVYISVLNDDSGVVTLKINQDFGSLLKLYDYFICDPESPYPYRHIASIDTSEKELQYPFTASIAADGNVKYVALCKESTTGSQIVQRLHIHPYKLKNDYDFYVYTIGDPTDSSARHQLLRSTNFWNFFNSVYSQAVVEHGSLFGEFISVDRDYIISRARYDHFIGEVCNSGGGLVSETIDNIYLKVLKGGHRRNVIQVGYPTKRFWPLTSDANGNIQICGKPSPDQDPTLNPSKFNLELETRSTSTCLPPKASVILDEKRKVWKLIYKDGRPEEDATITNINHSCMVFAEANLGNYVADFSLFAGASAASHDIGVSLAIVPWLGDSTAKTALHLLGQGMGLANIIGFPWYTEHREDERTGIMNINGSAKFLNLRQRAMVTGDSAKYFGCKHRALNGTICMEQQWDCLHKMNEACARSSRDPYYKP